MRGKAGVILRELPWSNAEAERDPIELFTAVGNGKLKTLAGKSGDTIKLNYPCDRIYIPVDILHSHGRPVNSWIFKANDI